MVLWEEAEIGEEGIAQEEGHKIVVGMVVAEVVRECMSAVAVGIVVAEVGECMSEVAVQDEHILAAVVKGDTGDEAELDEGVVGAGIAGWETEPAEADTGKAAETMENIAVVVARAVAHNYGA